MQDDWTILISLALLTPLNILCWMMANHGLGRDIWMLEFWEITRILYFFWYVRSHALLNVSVSKEASGEVHCFSDKDTLAIFGLNACILTD